MIKSICLLVVFFSAFPAAADYPDMIGVWGGKVRLVSSGDQVQGEVARGGALISDVQLTLTVVHQDGEVFVGESISDAPGSTATPVWGAIRSTGKEGVFVTATGGRGNIWFTTATQFEFCFANQTQAVMSSYCAILHKAEE
jgi:hypothetical protein